MSSLSSTLCGLFLCLVMVCGVATSNDQLQVHREDTTKGDSSAELGDTASKKPSDFPILTGPYLGQSLPGVTPQVFAPGIVSTNRDEHSAVSISPDGSEIFYTDVSLKKYPVVMHARLQDGIWTKPKIAFFSGEFWDDGVTFSRDGTRLYISTRRPLKKSDPPRKDSDVWYMERTNSGWAEPQYFAGPINSSADDGGLTFAKNGTVYFGSYRPGGPGDCNIYCSKLVDGEYTLPQLLDDSVNIGLSNFGPCIAPDESYLIWGCIIDEEAGIDLYISFRTADGAWTRARSMGPAFNSSFISWCPGLSPDSQYLFYSTLNPEGNLDIYWVDAKYIEELRP